MPRRRERSEKEDKKGRKGTDGKIWDKKKSSIVVRSCAFKGERRTREGNRGRVQILKVGRGGGGGGG